MLLRSVLAENLRRLRAERGLSQEALADLVGIDRTYVSALERQVYAATIDVIERLADTLRVPPIVLLTPASTVMQDEATKVITIQRPTSHRRPSK
jgi:transcriptional regulator with XRE-family HTH domain